MAQIKVPAAAAAAPGQRLQAVSCGSGTQTSLPRALLSVLPEDGSASRSEATSQHCCHLHPCCGHREVQLVLLKAPRLSCAPNRAALLVSLLPKTRGSFPAASAHTPDSDRQAQPSPGSCAEAAVSKHQDLQLSGSKSNALQNHKADF